MQSLSYFLALIASYSGIIAGIMISSRVKEELKEGKKYFILFQKGLIIVAASLFLNFLELNLVLRLLAYSIIIFSIALKKAINGTFLYCSLALIFFATSKDPNVFFAISTAIFMIGIATGSMMIAEKPNKIRIKETTTKALLETSPFILIAVILGIFL